MTIRRLAKLVRAATVLAAAAVPALFWTTAFRGPVAPPAHSELSLADTPTTGSSIPAPRLSSYYACWENGIREVTPPIVIVEREDLPALHDSYIYHAGFFIQSAGITRGYAAIFDGATDGLYAEDDEIGDYTLAQVFPEKAVLQKEGTLFTLARGAMPTRGNATPRGRRNARPSPGRPQGAAPIPVLLQPPPSARDEPRSQANPTPRPQQPATTRHFALPAEERDQITMDAATILTEAKPQFVRDENGSVKGVKVGVVKPGSALARMGVQTGDIVRKVNGTPVSDYKQLLDIRSQVTSGQITTLEVEIERNGRILTHTYDLSDGL